MVDVLLAIVGMPGSGKSDAAQFFSSKNIPILRFGDQTEIGLKEQGLPINEGNERAYREGLRKELGMAAMAIKIHPRIEEAAKTSRFIVLDGLYSWEELQYLKSVYPALQLLCMYASPTIRYERLSARPVRPLTQEEAMSRDVAEIENLNKGGPIAMADFMIDNTGTKESMIKQLEALYAKLV
jgi:dephospho-CoA kinase